MNALVFVVEAVIRAGARFVRQKALHFVLIEPCGANVFLVLLVLVVKLAGVAATCGLLLVVHKIPPMGLVHVFEAVKAILQYYLRRKGVNDLLSFFALGVCLVEVAGRCHGGHALVKGGNGQRKAFL